MDFPIELPPKVLQKALELGISPSEIEEAFIRGQGKGGQKINKTSSCVWLRHLSTGVEVKVQKHREQSKNRLSAYKALIDKIEHFVRGEESAQAKRIFKLRKQKQKRSKCAQEKVLEAKRQRSTIKSLRKKPVPFDSTS